MTYFGRWLVIFACRQDGRAQTSERRPQANVGDGSDSPFEFCGLRLAERATSRHPVAWRRPGLLQAEPCHNTVAKKTIDTLKQEWFAVLDFHCDSRCHPQSQGPVAAAASRKVEL